ncbi:MAG: hypothetical protein GY795_09190 [Desulfobacterales bacterium]|nr:hypothetical protein [Desulfobacterales bacterium]
MFIENFPKINTIVAFDADDAYHALCTADTVWNLPILKKVPAGRHVYSPNA